MSEVEAVQEAYRGKELTTARKRIREATSFADLEKAVTSISIFLAVSSDMFCCLATDLPRKTSS